MNPRAAACPPHAERNATNAPQRRHGDRIHAICWGDELDELPPAEQGGWLWHGYLGFGQVTLLTSQWKIGKSTLAAALLAKLKGGGTFAGRTLEAGRAIVVSEETGAMWQERKKALGFGSQVGFLCRPFAGKPNSRQWKHLLKQLLELHAAKPFQLLVIDPIASFLPGADENHAGGMMAKLLPLQRLTKRGVAVLLLHHPAKAASAVGRLARGSGALPAFADIVVEMRWVAGPRADDRRRRLTALSRSAETPADLILALNAEGTDYTSLGPPDDHAFQTVWRKLDALFDRADEKLTRKETAALWTAEEGKVDPITLWRWLERAVAEGKLRRDGDGSRTEPFRYWQPELELTWARNPRQMELPSAYAALRAHDRTLRARAKAARRGGT